MSKLRYDLVIVGAGSGNMFPADAFSGWRVAIVEADKFGGTCLNRGCIPSKMLVHTADIAQTVRHSDRFGIQAEFVKADWPFIRNRVFGRIDPIHESGVAYRRKSGVDVYLGEGSFIAPKTLRIGDDELYGKQFVLSSGSRPYVPPIPGISEVPYHTSDTIMRLDSLPKSMAILGGGFIAAETSHIFGSLGTSVTIIARGEYLLPKHDTDIRKRFNELYHQRFDLRMNSEVTKVLATDEGIRLELMTPEGPRSVEVEALLIATGRVPNSDFLNVWESGVQVDAHGHVITDDTFQTNVPGIWSLGDVTNHFQLKHMANAEARVVWHNVAHREEPRRATFRVVPSAVFSDPQVASVGATEQQLQLTGQSYISSAQKYSSAAYGWALEDDTSFAKVLADPDTRKLLGAHIIGPQASTLIQPLIQAMCLGNTVDQVSSEVLYIHPALSEVVEQVLLGL